MTSLPGARKVLLIALITTTCYGSAHAMNYFVADSAALHNALQTSLLGDTITLQAGVTFSGSFPLPKKSGAGWITIESSAIASMPPGIRVKPANAVFMPKIIAPRAMPALYTHPGAHHYRIRGIEFGTAPGIYNYEVIQLASGTETSVANLASYIEFDRVYIHGDPKVGGKRGIGLNSTYITVRESYICDFKSTFQDTQAVGGFNGPGPFDIINNYLEASGENIMFGGAIPAISGLVPSNIRILRNHLYKPLSWRAGSPNFAGTTWVVKNLLEFKNARNVTIEGNILENSWKQSQSGAAVLIAPNSESGRVPWVVSENLVFTKNIIRHAGSAFLIGNGDSWVKNASRRITIKDNLVEDIDNSWGGSGDFALIAGGPSYVTVDHNTLMHERAIAWFAYGAAPSFVFQNNIAGALGYGLIGDGTGPGSSTLAKYAPGSVVRRNALAGAPAPSYPADNYFPGSMSGVMFTNQFASNYLLLPSSPYKAKGTDGRDLGADIAALNLATAGVVMVTRP